MMYCNNSYFFSLRYFKMITLITMKYLIAEEFSVLELQCTSGICGYGNVIFIWFVFIAVMRKCNGGKWLNVVNNNALWNNMCPVWITIKRFRAASWDFSMSVRLINSCTEIVSTRSQAGHCFGSKKKMKMKRNKI